MKKQELIDKIKASTLVDKITEPKLESTNSFGDKTYTVNIRKIDGDAINYENIQFVVIDEGKAGEKAFFYKNDVIDFDNKHEQGTITAKK